MIADPARGVETLTLSAFEKIWTGHILELRPTARLETLTGKRKRNALWRFLA